MKNDNDESWELIYTTPVPYKAEIMRSLLDEENIDSVIINKQDSSYLNFGEIELYVKQAEVLQAKHIIDHIPENE